MRVVGVGGDALGVGRRLVLVIGPVGLSTLLG